MGWILFSLELCLCSVDVKQTGSRHLYGKVDGFLLCYKRLEQKASKFQWPRSQEEVCKLTSQQFRWLMEGLTIQPKKCIQKIDHPRFV